MTYEDLVAKSRTVQPGLFPDYNRASMRITQDRFTYRTWARRARMRGISAYRRRPTHLRIVPTSLNKRGELLLAHLEWRDRVHAALRLQEQIDAIRRAERELYDRMQPMPIHFFGRDGIYRSGQDGLERIDTPIVVADTKSRWLWRVPWWRRALRWILAPPPDTEQS